MKAVIPVVVIKDAADTVKTLEALRAGGINRAEITFRTACAEEAIRTGCAAFPDMEIGAGTVINAAQAKRAAEAGARFIVSPGFAEDVAEFCAERGMTYYPGCVTPTEIMRALAHGFNVVKFFPAAEYGGIATMKALSAPFPQVRFIPTGGVSLANLKEYLDFDKVYAVGGAFMMKGDIRGNCRRIREVIG